MEEIPNNHLGCITPCKKWDKLPTSTGERRISEPSTVWSTSFLIFLTPKGEETAPSTSTSLERKGKAGKPKKPWEPKWEHVCNKLEPVETFTKS